MVDCAIRNFSTFQPILRRSSLGRRSYVAFQQVWDALNFACAVADRMAVMYRCRFVETGSTEEVFQALKHP